MQFFVSISRTVCHMQHRRRFCQFRTKPILSTSTADESISRSEVLKMIDQLQQRRPYTDKVYLQKATYFCFVTNLEQEFVEVSDEWFRQAKLQVFDKVPYFKVTSDLCNLGKLNRVTNGYLLQKLTWPPIEYFMRRMADIGFHLFHARDIASAASGLQALTKIRAPTDTTNENRHLSPEFLDGLKQYLEDKQPTDKDWNCFIEDTVPYLLNLLSYVYGSERPPMELLSPLCRLSVLGFEHLLNNERPLRPSDIQNQLWYCRAFLRGWNLDPDSIVEGSWSSWYGVSSLVFRESAIKEKIRNEISFRYLREVMSVATVFDRLQDFWPLFEPWKRCVTDLCKSAGRLQSEPGTETVEKQLVNLVFTCGRFAAKCAEEAWKSDECRRTFQELLSVFEQALVSRPCSNVEQISMCRWLTGVQELNEELQLSYSLSDKYFSYLRDWCVHTRSAKTPPPNISHSTAAMLHLLKRMKSKQSPPSSTLRELVELFMTGLDSLDDRAMMSLEYFASSVVALSIELDEKQRRQYFDKVRSILIDSWPKEASARDRTLFLASIIHVACARGLGEELKAIKSIYEKRTDESSDCFAPKVALFLARKMVWANGQFGVGFDARLTKKLFVVAASNKA